MSMQFHPHAMLFPGGKIFEGHLSQREHVHDGKVQKECHHLQRECDVSVFSPGFESKHYIHPFVLLGI